MNKRKRQELNPKPVGTLEYFFGNATKKKALEDANGQIQAEGNAQNQQYEGIGQGTSANHQEGNSRIV